MRTKAVLFDLGNTLYKYDNKIEVKVFHRVLLSLGFAKSLGDINMARAHAEQEAEDLDFASLYGKIRGDEYWYRWFSLILKHLAIHSDKVARLICSRWFDHLDCSPFPEVKHVLSKLRQMGLKIGLVTNAYEEEISIILGKANLDLDIFDVIVGTDTVKKTKPDPEIFRYALNKLEVKPEEALFIGDSIKDDYKGAENMGMKAVLLERMGSKTKSVDTRIINSLDGIFNFCI